MPRGVETYGSGAGRALKPPIPIRYSNLVFRTVAWRVVFITVLARRAAQGEAPRIRIRRIPLEPLPGRWGCWRANLKIGIVRCERGRSFRPHTPRQLRAEAARDLAAGAGLRVGLVPGQALLKRRLLWHGMATVPRFVHPSSHTITSLATSQLRTRPGRARPAPMVSAGAPTGRTLNPPTPLKPCR